MKLASIQILRGLAAMMVVIYHVRAIEGLAIAESRFVLEHNLAAEPGLVSGLWANGFVGVDLFFVISGFVMVYVTRDVTPGVHTVASFLFARITRIYPVWWLFAGLMAAYFLFAYGAPVDVAQAARASESPVSHLVKSLALVPQGVPPVLGVGWTLVHEMYFYWVFALILLFARGWTPWLLVGWAVMVGVGWAAGLSGGFADDYPALIFYPMTLEFILGAFSALVVLRGWIWRPGWVAIGGAVWLAVMMHMVPPPETDTDRWAGFILQWGRVLLFGVPAVVLVHGLAGLEWQRAGGWFRGHIAAGLSAIGDWSYSLYLSHMLVLSFLRRALPWGADVAEGQLGLPADIANLFRLGHAGVADNITFLVLSIPLTLAVSAVAFTMFERPLTRRFSGLRRQLLPT